MPCARSSAADRARGFSQTVLSSPEDGSFALTDHHGRDVTEADYRGRFVLIYFGITDCRVVCPRSGALIRAARFTRR